MKFWWFLFAVSLAVIGVGLYTNNQSRIGWGTLLLILSCGALLTGKDHD